MSSVDDFPPTGYQDDDADREVHSTVSERVVVKKKGSKLPLIIFVIFLVVALGVAGLMLLGGSKKAAKKAPAQPKEQVEAPATEAAPTGATPADPATDPFAAGQAPNPAPGVDPNTAVSSTTAIDPATGLPVQTAVSAQTAIDPATGLPVAQVTTTQQAIDPATGLPMTVQPAVSTTTQVTSTPAMPGQVPGQVPGQMPRQMPGQMPGQMPQQPTVIDPATGLPAVAPTTTTVQTTTTTQPVAPVVQPAVPQQPAVDPFAQAQQAQEQAEQSQVAAVADPSDPLSQFRTLLAPIDSRVTALEKKFAGLEKTVRALQSRFMGSSSSKSSSKSSKNDRPRSTNTVKVVQSRPVRAPVSRVIIDGDRYYSDQPTSNGVRYEETPRQARYASMDSCNIQAIVQGRVWVKRSDGSFVSFGEGDTWTNGSVIQSIDPSRGINVNGRWVCM